MNQSINQTRDQDQGNSGLDEKKEEKSQIENSAF
jgi:hypothetical protein